MLYNNIFSKFSNWEYSADAYLSGLTQAGQQLFFTFEDAQLNAIRYPDARGITYCK